MARIRSIHPGLFTDELYMALSMAGKAVWPGLWTEADDHGVFEWKPLSLKARLMPCADIDIATTLGEYEALGLVIKFSEGEKAYGVIKGFCHWQRPKKPLNRFPLPNQFPTKTPLLPQNLRRGRRKEEGGKR